MGLEQCLCGIDHANLVHIHSFIYSFPWMNMARRNVWRGGERTAKGSVNAISTLSIIFPACMMEA